VTHPPFYGSDFELLRLMSDPHPRSAQPELPTVVPVPEQLGYAIHLNQTDLEWMVVIMAPQERQSVVLGADREAVLAKAHQWIAARAASKDSP
jgi:hypothetical protein